MGLDTTHDCWHGSYRSFNIWRHAVARSIGIDLMQMDGFGGDTAWESLAPDPLHILLMHSDCDGEIDVEHLLPLADRLANILPQLEAAEDSLVPPGFRHSDLARRFAAGLRKAALLGERVEFH